MLENETNFTKFKTRERPKPKNWDTDNQPPIKKTKKLNTNVFLDRSICGDSMQGPTRLNHSTDNTCRADSNAFLRSQSVCPQHISSEFNSILDQIPGFSQGTRGATSNFDSVNQGGDSNFPKTVKSITGASKHVDDNEADSRPYSSFSPNDEDSNDNNDEYNPCCFMVAGDGGYRQGEAEGVGVREPLSETLAREESYWRQKSRDLWLSEGDRNTKFFHSSSNLKRLHSRISCIHDSNGNTLIDEDDIAPEAVRFFKSLLSVELVVVDDEFVNSIPPLVSPEDNRLLMAPFSLAELKEIVFSMHPKKAPGPDGFTALFFQRCWDFIGNDLLLTLEESRRNRSILREINTTLIAIIPKVDNPTSFSDFHPIALCNTLYKIFTKAISIRLSKLLPRIIYLEQGGFVPGWETPEGAIVAHEILHSISQKKVPAMILKLDMLKAYDRVNWQSLVAVLYRFGFSHSWVKWVFSCIRVDGLPSSQSHCLFADDTLLFGMASMREARVIKKIIYDYAAFSGQKVNNQKSKVFFVNVPTLVRDNLACFWSFHVGTFRCMYLGIPFFLGLDKTSFWDKVVHSITSRITSWNHKWLTMAGKILLIKSVLSVIPTYLMSILQASSQVIKKIKVSLKTFLWSDNLGGQTKIPLLAWDKICRPKEVGGAGIRDLVIQNKALGAKLIWKLYANPQSKWASVMLAKYLRGAPSERIFTATSLPKGSPFWNFLISCREVILPHLSWVVHNGKKARFWDEFWNGHPALSTIRDWSPLPDILSDLWGPFVADYFNIVTSGPCLVAKWKDIPPLSINNDIILAFIEELHKRPLLSHMKEDSLVWVKNATGSYLVKEGYNSLVQAPLPSCWPTKLFWHPACLPKAGAFAWLAVQDKVLTGMQLDRLGITTVFPCVFCGYCMGSMDHLFFLCPFAFECWYWLFDMLGWSSALCPNLLSQFMSWPLLFPSSFYSSLWVVAPSLLIWNLWLERNSRIFKHKSSSLTVIIGKIQASISEVVLAFIHRNLDHLRSFSHWDNWVTWRWSLLHLMPSHGVIIDGVSSTLKRKMAKWSPPPFPSFKLQFDGASKGNPGRSGVGALSFGLDLARSLNIKDIVIEGDSMLMAPFSAYYMDGHMFANYSCVVRTTFTWFPSGCGFVLCRALESCDA
ncbi:uncharacterized protein LOC131874206 [Cryptomeria japonica]|uniref:uncharacterized protein LOC131874206 n=1 Tax=Cryptomeria japonica TaxID=3369 RepID=UPI0027DAB217|nr:uncharacterized protein LOC131874206 [Cryptomeria japonica]